MESYLITLKLKFNVCKFIPNTKSKAMNDLLKHYAKWKKSDTK